MLIATRVLIMVISLVLAITLVQTQITHNTYEQIFSYAMENEKTISALEITNKHNYVQLTTQADNNDDRVSEGLCNKLLESCPVPNTELGNDNKETATEQENAADISEKYFEQPDQEIPASPLTSEHAGQNATSIEQPVLLNQSNITLPGNLTQAETGFETYEDPILGFKVSHPIGWERIENSTERFSLITLVSPQESTPDPVVERLVLRINNYPTNLTLDDYSMRVKDALEKNSNFNVINFSSTELSANPAYGVIGTESEGGRNVDVIDNWTIKDGIVYRIVFYSDNAKSAEYLPMREKIIDSFSITG